MFDDKTPWWEAHDNFLTSHYKEFIRDEAESSVVQSFENSIIPGLLQTEAYARAISSLSWPSTPTPDEIDARVEIRLKRQWEVLGRSSPPQTYFVIDESALYRQLGGTGILYEQLVHLSKVAASPHITLQILPISIGSQWYPYGVACFTVFSFTAKKRESTLYVDQAPFYSKPVEGMLAVDLHQRAFAKLQLIADNPKLTNQRIEQAIAMLETQSGICAPLKAK